MMRFIYLFILANMSIFTFGQSRVSNSHHKTKYKECNVIVKLKESIDLKGINAEQDLFLKDKKLVELHKKLNVVTYENLINQFFLIKYRNKKYSVEDVLKLYKKSKYVESAQPNYIGRSRKIERVEANFPNDEFYSYQWYLNNKGNYELLDGDYDWDPNKSKVKAGADIKMEKAWALEKGNDKIIIAIVDGGVYMDHPEFNGRIWKNEKEIPNNGKDDDGNGYIDDINGWDFLDNDNSPEDVVYNEGGTGGHGTACAGIAAATNDNNIGYAGINGHAKIMPVRVDGAGFTEAALVKGLKYAADNGANVINLSLGMYKGGDIVKEGVTYAYNKGCVMVAATANDAIRIGGEETFCEGNEKEHDFPGCFPEVITVGGTTYNDARMVWVDPKTKEKGGSAYGNHVDVVAPGYSILTLGFTPDAPYPYFGRFGCSFATPQVTGVISLMLSMNPDLTFEEVRDIIRKSADDLVGREGEDVKGRDMYMGYGRLNAYKALLETQKTLGVEDIFKDEASTKVFPNPVKDNLTVKTSKKIKKLTVYTVLGQELLEVNETNKIDLSKLSSGVYLLKITLINGGAFVKKIVHE